MPFYPFELERWQSEFEHRVWCNLSESGVHPLTIEELLALAGGSIDELATIQLGYSQGDGSDALREAIAKLYPGATGANVTVTTGSAEANFITTWSLVEPGDTVAVMTPTYMQTPGLARNFGATVTEFGLRAEQAWEPDLDQITEAIVPGTRLVVVTNPNNPTGHILSDEARRAIISRAGEVGAWILADEVYQGAELDGRTTPSFWGMYDRLIVVSGFSKAYGLPGLRIGWTVGPTDFKSEVIRRHDYTVICPAPASDYLATKALAVREKILARTRAILQANYPILDAWLQQFGGLFEWHAPQCGAICLARYSHAISALDLVESVREHQDILLVPGDHFDRPHHIRFGFGNEQQELRKALERLTPTFAQLVD
jgi:aspartate/methionine/tyrosine aminotransferase